MRNLRTEQEIMASWKGGPAKPMVSICCITYNHELYIEDALNGFLVQETDFPFEILIHDDASTDGTAEIIRKYEARYPNLIKPIYQTENQYSQGNKPGKINRDRAKGKYIAFCEGDDYWIDPLKLQIQVDFLESNPEYGLVHTDNSNFYQETGKIKQSHKETYYPAPPNGKIFDKLIEKNCISTLTVVAKADIIKMANKKILSFMDHGLIMDYALWLEVSRHTKIMYLNIVTAMYRISKETASRPSSIEGKRVWVNKIIKIKLFFMNYYNVSNKKKQKIINGFISDKLRIQFRKDDYNTPICLDCTIFEPSNIKENILFYLFKCNAPRFLFIIIESPVIIKRKARKLIHKYHHLY